MRKAYDKVDSSYLKLVLLHIGLNFDMVSAIIGCVRLCNYDALLNGEPLDFFSALCGIHQGFPLSPFCFLVITEGLNNIMEAKSKGRKKRVEFV